MSNTRMLILTWVFRLDQEVDLVSMYLRLLALSLKELLSIPVIVYLQIYPSPWNAVKVAYLFCRYYPLAIAPFHLWGFLVDHEQQVCESYYHALYACIIPTVRPLVLPTQYFLTTWI